MSVFQLNAQSYSFLNYSTKDGLAQSQVYSITQDSKNYLWIATLDGLSKFDGKNFENFFEKDGLLNNRINQVYADKNDNIWITSYGGISIFKKNKIIPFSHNHLLEESEVLEIIIDKTKLWVSTDKNGLFLFELAEKTGLYSFVNKFYVEYNNMYIRDIHLYNNAILLGTDEGVFKIENNVSTKENYLNGYDISAISENSKGELWISTLHDGIFEILGDKVRNISQDNSNLLNNYINNLYIDKNDKIWASSNSALSEIISKNQIALFGIKPSRAEINYGYIEHDGSKILSFKEKITSFSLKILYSF